MYSFGRSKKGHFFSGLDAWLARLGGSAVIKLIVCFACCEHEIKMHVVLIVVGESAGMLRGLGSYPSSRLLRLDLGWFITSADLSTS